MVYITVKQSPMYRQMTMEEFLFGKDTGNYVLNANETNPRTYCRNYLTGAARRQLGADPQTLLQTLNTFNTVTSGLRERPRHDLYREFYIPKKSGGFRKIDAPNDELMGALRSLKRIFEEDFRVLYHTSAFAYIKNRSTLDAIKRHQANESRWYAKFDLHNFFGSTTLDFIIQQFSMIYPFSEVVALPHGKEALETALSLAMLDGGLPQGTPISPLITNIMMIPVDFKLANTLREFDDSGTGNKQRFVYTRYADDFQISSRYNFRFRSVEKLIEDTLREFNAPFTINKTKTRYGSRAGKNFNLGVVVNKDNVITVGHKKKRQFKAMLTSYVLDTRNGIVWDKSDIQVLEGYRNYYRMVEQETIDGIVKAIGEKFNVDIVKMIKEDLRT